LIRTLEFRLGWARHGGESKLIEGDEDGRKGSRVVLRWGVRGCFRVADAGSDADSYADMGVVYVLLAMLDAADAIVGWNGLCLLLLTC
jgi:hypothetical protein